MKKTVLSLTVLTALIAFTSSCKKIILDAGPLTEEVRELDEDFSRISISGSLDLLVNQDNGDNVLTLEAGEKILEHIETYVQDGTLYIDEESNNFLTSGVRRVYVNQEFLDEIEMLGSGDCEADGILTTDFELKMEGSGDSDIEFTELESLDVSMDGSGDCEVKGEGDEFTLGVNGSGDCNARFLEVSDATVNINGSGDVEVFASESLLININGSGDVNYWGDPVSTNFNINGSGDVNGHE